MPSLEQGRSYEMLLPMMSEDFVAEGDASSALSLACRGCPWLCCENSVLSLTFSTNTSEISSFLKLSGDSLSNFLKLLKSLLKLLAV